MRSDCYAMVRGSALRVTSLTPTGALPSGSLEYGVSKSVSRVQISELSESGGNELIKAEDTDTTLLRVTTNAETIRFETDIRFLRCDPKILSLITGVPVVTNASGDVVGFDANTHIPAKAFALEVWSKLAVRPIKTEEQVGFGLLPFGTGPFGLETEVQYPYYCGDTTYYGPRKGFGKSPFGRGGFGRDMRGDVVHVNRQTYGYTLFPFLKGGTLSGFEFNNGLVSFSVQGAQTRKNPGWGVGPYDLDGPHIRLDKPVSRNTAWRNMVLTTPPPEPTTGTVTFDDIIYGGNAAVSTADIIYGGNASVSTPDIIEGGKA